MVKVSHRIAQRIYGNYMSHNTLYMCHDEYELCNIGDEVLIQKSKPYSKRKHWKIHSWVKREPSALWFKIHPEYSINQQDKERLAQKVDFDYKFEQQAFEFTPKEIYEIQEGVRQEKLLPERVKRTMHDQLVVATLVSRSVRKSPENKLENARMELKDTIESEKRKRERYGLPLNWALDDEPGTVTVARMNLRTAQNEYEAHQGALRDIVNNEEQLIKRAKNIPDDQPAFPHLSGFLKGKYF